jgi:hypothetical protein
VASLKSGKHKRCTPRPLSQHSCTQRQILFAIRVVGVSDILCSVSTCLVNLRAWSILNVLFDVNMPRASWLQCAKLTLWVLLPYVCLRPCLTGEMLLPSAIPACQTCTWYSGIRTAICTLHDPCNCAAYVLFSALPLRHNQHAHQNASVREFH